MENPRQGLPDASTPGTAKNDVPKDLRAGVRSGDTSVAPRIERWIERTFSNRSAIKQDDSGGGRLDQVAQALSVEQTRRRMAEATLAQLQEQTRLTDETCFMLARAMDQSADGLCITNSHGVIEYVNAAFEALTGFDRAHLLGQTPAVLKSGMHGREFYERLWRTVKAGEVAHCVFVDRRSDGSLVHLAETITPLRDAGGEITHYMATARDITARVRTETALRKLNENLEQLAGHIAQALHDEAGQFLTAAHIALANAARDAPDETRERLQEVRSHLDAIETQIRRFAHELRPAILDDLGLVRAVEHLVDGARRRHGLDIDLRLDNRKSIGRAAETTIYRLLQEALTNIARHARAHTVSISLRLDDKGIWCAVADDGVGFDAAARLDGGGAPGMGLNGIRGRVEALGGTFDVQSCPGAGTRLTAFVPREA